MYRSLGCGVNQWFASYSFMSFAAAVRIMPHFIVAFLPTNIVSVLVALFSVYPAATVRIMPHFAGSFLLTNIGSVLVRFLFLILEKPAAK